MLKLHKALVGLQMEYCVLYWPLYLKDNATLMEAVQKRFARPISGMGR